MSESTPRDYRFSYPVAVRPSTGGIDALSRLVETLPEDFAAPLVIAQHLDPQSKSYLTRILARRSTLPVRTVKDSAPLEAGVDLAVPANRHVRIDDHEISLTRDGGEWPITSVDRLMETFANVLGGPRAARGESFEMHLSFILPSGERRAFEARGRAIEDGGSAGGGVVFRDLAGAPPRS